VKKKRFSLEQISGLFKQAEFGAPIAELCRQHGIFRAKLLPLEEALRRHGELKRLRDECLNISQFLSQEDAKSQINTWRDDYNHHRPHSSTGHLTPNEFAMRHLQNRIAEAAKL
jgi:transposase InsO family protein